MVNPKKTSNNPPKWLKPLIITTFAVMGAALLVLILIIHHLQTSETKNLPNINLQQINHYPAAYTGAKLPQYPGADITYFGNSSDNFKKGIILYLYSKDSLTSVTKFYDTKMAALGWHVDILTDSGGSISSRTYTKKAESFQLTATNDNDHTNIIIHWHLTNN